MSLQPSVDGQGGFSAVVQMTDPQSVNRLLNGKLKEIGGCPVSVAPNLRIPSSNSPLPPLEFEPKVLILGDGNFSFAAALARIRRSGVGIIASSLPPLEEVKAECGDVAARAIRECELLGVTLHGKFDATMADFRVNQNVRLAAGKAAWGVGRGRPGEA